MVVLLNYLIIFPLVHFPWWDQPLWQLICTWGEWRVSRSLMPFCWIQLGMCPKADSLQCHSLGLATPVGYVPHPALIYPELRRWFSFKKYFFHHVWQVLSRNFWSDTHVLEICLFPILTPGSPPHSIAITLTEQVRVAFFFLLAKSDPHFKNYY